MFLSLIITQTTTQAQQTNTAPGSQRENNRVILEVHGSPLTLLTSIKNGHAYVGHINIVNKSEIKASGIVPYFLGTSLEGQIKVIKNTCEKGLEPNAVCAMEFSAKQVPVSQSSILLQGQNIIDTPIDIQINERSDAIGMQIGGGKIVSLSDKHNPFNLIVSTNMINEFHRNWFSWFPNFLSLEEYKILEKHATSTKNGAKNTKTIVALTNKQGSAAQACASYSINSEGISPCTGTLGEVCYHDWYLPAKDELNAIYKNWEKIGEMNNSSGYDWYWSSTHVWVHNAWGQNFGAHSNEPGVQRELNIVDKSAKVRCVRSI